TLLQSHQLARQVVERVGLKKLRPEVGEGSWLKFYVQPADSPGRPEELAATKLLDRLSVTTDGRAYLITVRYKEARDPELATLIANAFVGEILRKTQLEILAQQRSSTQASLSKRLAKFGDKYPRVIEAKLQLVAIDHLPEKWQRETHDEILRAAGENVTLA